MRYSLGDFVISSSNDWGVGKVVSADPINIEVEYFDSVAPDGRTVVRSRPDALRPYRLRPQTRVYVQEDGVWHVGRVVDHQANRYFIQLPNQRLVTCGSAPLYVRWNRPIADPVDVLAAGGMESPYFHDARHPFVTSIVRQRAAARGLAGVVSSGVELHEHQVEIARRVLTDPVQRYLLADEVGLGKTIEAGLIIRQLLLEGRGLRVLVLAPRLLVGQWRNELRSKFFVDDFPADAVMIRAYEDTDAWFDRTDVGLLVVDEAHHVAQPQTGPAVAARYDMLAALARRIPRVLLLSATPLLNNEASFLAMLHLLDPGVYRLDDREGFRARVRDRAALANTFYSLDEQTPGFLLQDTVDDLRRLLKGDERLGTLLDALEQAVLTDDPTQVATHVRRVRVHVSETYRLHRRLLRTRRTDRLTDTFPLRGRTAPEVVRDDDPRRQDVDALLHAWRDDHAAHDVRAATDAAATDITAGGVTSASATTASAVALRRLALAMYERAGSDLAVLGAFARYRLDGRDADSTAAHVNDAERAALLAVRVRPEERDLLERLVDACHDSEEPTRIQRLVTMITAASTSSKTVVFTSFTPAAEAIVTALTATLGHVAVAQHLQDDDAGTVDAAVERFRTDPQCRVLVCDRSGEEGRNFQFADQLIHFDVPWSPNRLEQRIGRVDRFGGWEPATNIVFGARGTQDAWLACLRDGFGVFDRSVASLQFSIDELLPNLVDAFLHEGEEALGAWTAELPDRLEAERREIEEQDALDAIDPMESAAAFSEALADLDRDWGELQQVTDGWACDAPGNLRFRRIDDPDRRNICSYHLVRPGQPLNVDTLPLVSWDLLQRHFDGIANKPGSYHRLSALRSPNARVFRIGDSFIDGLTQVTRVDDRGQAFAMWRVDPRWPHPDLLAFTLTFVIDADVAVAEAVLREADPSLPAHPLRARADALLAPVTDVVWIAANGKEITSPRLLLRTLQRPYDNARDYNLSAERRWALEELVDPEAWDGLCRRVRAEAEQVLRERTDLERRTDEAAARATRTLEAGLEQRRLRLAALPTADARAAEQHELEFEERLTDALITGVRTPGVRADAMGVVVLSSRVPEGPGFDRQHR